MGRKHACFRPQRARDFCNVWLWLISFLFFLEVNCTGNKTKQNKTKKNKQISVSWSPPINSERCRKEKNQPKLMSVFQSVGKILRKGREFIVWNKWLKIFKDIHKNVNGRNNEKKLFHGRNFCGITFPLL